MELWIVSVGTGAERQVIGVITRPDLAAETVSRAAEQSDRVMRLARECQRIDGPFAPNVVDIELDERD